MFIDSMMFKRVCFNHIKERARERENGKENKCLKRKPSVRQQHSKKQGCVICTTRLNQDTPLN